MFVKHMFMLQSQSSLRALLSWIMDAVYRVFRCVRAASVCSP